MDYCSGLENRRSVAIRGRGFESHAFLQQTKEVLNAIDTCTISL